MSRHRASIDLFERHSHASAIFPDPELYSLSYSASKFFLPPGGDVMLGREVCYARNCTRFFLKNTRTKSPNTKRNFQVWIQDLTQSELCNRSIMYISLEATT